jgi:hypothetical protein
VNEADALERLNQTGDAILEGVTRWLPGYVVDRVSMILDAWGHLDDAARADADARVRVAGDEAARRIADELRRLLATDPTQQRATPLEIVRSVIREPTALLTDLGVPPVVRDEFEERTFPEDAYGLVPHTLGELGDESLAPLHLAWGLAKTAVLRPRADG